MVTRLVPAAGPQCFAGSSLKDGVGSRAVRSAAADVVPQWLLELYSTAGSSAVQTAAAHTREA